MFRLVNCTKNYIKRLCRITQHYIQKVQNDFIRAHLSIPVYQLRETPSQNPNSGHQWRNSPSQWRNSPSQCRNSASQWKNSPSQWRNSASQWKNSASQWRKSGHQWVKSISGNMIPIDFSIWLTGILKTRQPILITNKIQLLTLKF